ncbi:MAG: hypothetical protein HC842_04720 [Cytophagales bacterium]|nr:hypothetical protein [Cytophagales bacterium]
MIDHLMLQNRERITELNTKLESSLSENSRLYRAMITLKEELEDKVARKDSQIVHLKAELEEMNTTVHQLNQDIYELKSLSSKQKAQLQDQEKELYTSFFAIGTHNELKEKEIIVMVGGVLGLGKTEQLNPKFDPSHFEPCDIQRKRLFMAKGNKVKLLTHHPADSYEMTYDADKGLTVLEVLRPEEFWKISRFLVLQR